MLNFCDQPHRCNRFRSTPQLLIREIVSIWTRTLRHLRPHDQNLSSHKTMNNTELTLDQLVEVAGGFLHHANIEKLVGATMRSFKKHILNEM